jgi:hypothetical protein
MKNAADPSATEFFPIESPLAHFCDPDPPISTVRGQNWAISDSGRSLLSITGLKPPDSAGQL